MAHRLVRAGVALAATAVLTLPTAAFADGAHDHESPPADPHAEHGGHGGHAEAESDAHDQHEDESAGTAHDDAAPSPDGHANHDDHAPAQAPTEEPRDHGATSEDDGGGHTDHGTAPDSVSPEVRDLVLSGFAGVNAAVIFGAWMVRRTGPDPDPRKLAPRASR